MGMGKKAKFLNACNGHGHFNLPLGYLGRVLPIYQNEPASLIAYTLGSLEYNSLNYQISVEEMRSCRDRGIPTIDDIEHKIEMKKNDRRKFISENIDAWKKANNLPAPVPIIHTTNTQSTNVNTCTYTVFFIVYFFVFCFLFFVFWNVKK